MALTNSCGVCNQVIDLDPELYGTVCDDCLMQALGLEETNHGQAR